MSGKGDGGGVLWVELWQEKRRFVNDSLKVWPLAGLSSMNENQRGRNAMQLNKGIFASNVFHVAIVAGLMSLAPLSSAAATSFTDQMQAQEHAHAVKAWHNQIKRMGAPSAGCFRVTYPSTTFVKHACGSKAAYVATPLLATKGLDKGLDAKSPDAKHVLAAGDTGTDYYAQAASPIQSATGSFPSVTGVSSVTSVYSNLPSSSGQYTLQLNTNMAAGSDTLCEADGQQPGCYVWEQFVYGTNQAVDSSPTVLIQTWLFPSNPADGIPSQVVSNMTCPAGWTLSPAGGGCYHNAYSTESVPLIAPSDLANTTLEGAIDSSGNDTAYLTFTDSNGNTATEVVSQSDTVADFAANWTGAEFNVVGDGDASDAEFNDGSSITVELAINDGGADVPTCEGGTGGGQFSGATGEGNNLTLGACSATAGSAATETGVATNPYIEFTESNGNSSSSGWGFWGL